MRKVPIVLIIITGGISAVFLGYFSAYIATNKTIGIWCLYGGIAFSFLSGFLYWQNEIWADEYNKQTTQHNPGENPTVKERIHKTPPTKIKSSTKTKESEPQTSKNLKSETYSIKSINQSGGITIGKIEHVNIITDKESLGIREPNGIYQNGKKLGTVINFKANDSSKTFTISEIQFDKPLLDTNTIWQPLAYQGYILHIRHIDELVTMMPPGARGVAGNILSNKP